ncbi:hypothetical protein [Methylobacterium sp. CM6244]
MKVFIGAAIIAATMISAADAAEMPLSATVNSVDEAASVGDLVTRTAWVGRYGQICRHGPVWIASCHATNQPGPYIPGHWNPMRTRWIPGYYV